MSQTVWHARLPDDWTMHTHKLPQWVLCWIVWELSGGFLLLISCLYMPSYALHCIVNLVNQTSHITASMQLPCGTAFADTADMCWLAYVQSLRFIWAFHHVASRNRIHCRHSTLECHGSWTSRHVVWSKWILVSTMSWLMQNQPSCIQFEMMYSCKFSRKFFSWPSMWLFTWALGYALYYMN